jgi:hypothetical protein
MNIKKLWNSQADHQNQWDSLGEDEKLEFVAAHEREECAKICDAHGFYGVAPAREIRARRKT